MSPFGTGDVWRVKVVAGWACLAPVAAMVLVFAIGDSKPPGQLVVDGTNTPRADSVFDDLAAELPPGPGVDGSLGTQEKSQIEIPITGTTDGKPLPPGTPAIGNTSGIPGTVLAAYQKAANELAVSTPGCGITWPLLAGIGKVESSHASGGRVDAAGLTRGQILGPVLDGGPGMAAISDTDQGQFDGNTQWDRAVGPMQFIPGTWASFGADGNGDGIKNPHNVFDAARAAGEYLCSGGANLRDPQGLVQAVLRYNHSMDYVSTVLRWMQTYSQSTVTLPDTEGVIPQSTGDDGNVEPGGDPTEEPTGQATTTPTPTPTPTQGLTTTTAPTQPPVQKPTPGVTTPFPPKTPVPSKPPWQQPPSQPTKPPQTQPTSTPTPPTSTPPDTPTPPPDTPTPPPDTPTPTPTDPVTETPPAETPSETGANLSP